MVQLGCQAGFALEAAAVLAIRQQLPRQHLQGDAAA
jgi:hypothetical protein